MKERIDEWRKEKGNRKIRMEKMKEKMKDKRKGGRNEQ